MGMQMDVCEEEQVTEVLAKIQEQFGLLNVLVNNAGITRDNILLRMKPEQWNEVLETNLTSVYRLTKSALRPMVKARYGRIINISSVVGVTGNPGQANYVAAKAGLIGFTKALAIEMAAYGITANVVAPGFIATDMTLNLNEKQQEAIMNMIPMKHMGRPEDIAYAVGFLAAEQASYITGQTIHINGGMYLG
jgi:3-oxoacyl-[acyl-carrier protein] reductase